MDADTVGTELLVPEFGAAPVFNVEDVPCHHPKLSHYGSRERWLRVTGKTPEEVRELHARGEHAIVADEGATPDRSGAAYQPDPEVGF